MVDAFDESNSFWYQRRSWKRMENINHKFSYSNSSQPKTFNSAERQAMGLLNMGCGKVRVTRFYLGNKYKTEKGRMAKDFYYVLP